MIYNTLMASKSKKENKQAPVVSVAELGNVLADSATSDPKAKPVKAKVKPATNQKKHRKRDKNRVYPVTLDGRVINMTPAGSSHFAKESVKFCDALHYKTAHKKITRKGLKQRKKLKTRPAYTIIQEVNGKRESAVANKENQITAVEDHIVKATARMKYLEEHNKPFGKTKDRIQRWTDSLTRLKLEVKDPSIFFCRDLYEAQPAREDFKNPLDYQKAHAAWKAEFYEVRHDRFGSTGCHTEKYGNTTYQLRADSAMKFSLKGEENTKINRHLKPRDYYLVPIYHSKKKLGELRLTPKDFDALVAYQKTKEAVTVLFIKEKRKKKRRWHGKITLMEEGPLPYLPSNHYLAWDLNKNNRLEWILYSLENNQIVVLDYDEINLTGLKSDHARTCKLRCGIRKLMELAIKYRAQVAFENLDLRKLKAKDHGKGMNRTLHGIAYAKVMEIAVRTGKKLGVPVKLVPAYYTSICGGIFTPQLTQLNRDLGAALVIGLLSNIAGMNYLNQRCLELLAHGGLYRTNRKGHKNLTVRLTPLPTEKVEAEATPAETGKESYTKTNEGRRRSIADSRNGQVPFYEVGLALKTLQDNLFLEIKPPKKRKLRKNKKLKDKKDRAGEVKLAGTEATQCPLRVSESWLAQVRVKVHDLGPVRHALAVGALNLKNSSNFWASL